MLFGYCNAISTGEGGGAGCKVQDDSQVLGGEAASNANLIHPM